MADAWTWVAELADGRRLAEADLGTFTAVPLAECVAVELRPVGWPWGRKPVRLAVDLAAGERAECFRRRGIVVRLDGGPRQNLPCLTVVGIAGKGYLLVEDNGQVSLAGRA